MSNDPPSAPQKHRSLAERFDQRVIRLRRQANIFLGIIIAVLVGGAAAFVFANDITNLTLRPQTSEAQNAATTEAINRAREASALLDKEIQKSEGISSIDLEFDSKFKPIVEELINLSDTLLQTCTNISRVVPNSEATRLPRSPLIFSESPLQSRIRVPVHGDFSIQTGRMRLANSH